VYVCVCVGVSVDICKVEAGSVKFHHQF